MRKIKKITKSLIINKFVTNVIKSSTLAILLLLFSFGSFFAKGILAEEAALVEPPVQETQITDTQPAPTETIVENNAQVENSIDQTADTGSNVIASPTPEPSVLPELLPEPSPSPTPTPSPSIEPQSSPEPSLNPSPSPDTSIDNNADLTNNVNSSADSGNNSISEPEPTTGPEPTPDSVQQEATSSASVQTIDTGDAISVVEAENSVNSTEVNSNVLTQTLNIFLSGDVDLTVVPYIIAEAVFAESNQNLQVVNVAVFNVNNYAYLSNDVVSLANTGTNSISGEGQAVINTGNAYSIVSLVNQVNTTIIDSTIHIVTINIFGTVNGNIILPELSSNGQCCGQVTQIESQATVENNVTSSAVSGQNEIITTGEGSITTGNSQSAVNVVNFVNTNITDMLFQYLFINTFGAWQGDFLGWNSILAAEGGGNLTLTSLAGGGSGSGCPTCIASADIYSEAYVANNISSTANTGGNSVSSEGSVVVKTGNAYSAVSLLNFINTNIIRSIGFFGFVNIFGTLNGDVGGEDEFLKDDGDGKEETDIPPANILSDSDNDDSQNTNVGSTREAGGKLEVEQKNSVGEYVLPGDTITFFVRVRNTGTGKVYDAKTRISFFQDGIDLGGAIFNLGDIEAGKGVKLTTGLVLSKDIKPGSYIARVRVWGEAGDALVSDIADSAFLVGGTNSLPILSASSGILPMVLASEYPPGEVLGSQRNGLSLEQKLWILLVSCIGAYLLLRAIRERRKLGLVVNSLRSFLFSHFPPFF